MALELVAGVAGVWLSDSLAKNGWAAWSGLTEALLALLRREFGWGPLLDLAEDLSEEMWDRLADYLEGNRLLLECLDLALVEDREAISNRMLLPPG